MAGKVFKIFVVGEMEDGSDSSPVTATLTIDLEIIPCDVGTVSLEVVDWRTLLMLGSYSASTAQMVATPALECTFDQVWVVDFQGSNVVDIVPFNGASQFDYIESNDDAYITTGTEIIIHFSYEDVGVVRYTDTITL